MTPCFCTDMDDTDLDFFVQCIPESLFVRFSVVCATALDRFGCIRCCMGSRRLPCCCCRASFTSLISAAPPPRLGMYHTLTCHSCIGQLLSPESTCTTIRRQATGSQQCTAGVCTHKCVQLNTTQVGIQIRKRRCRLPDPSCTQTQATSRMSSQ